MQYDPFQQNAIDYINEGHSVIVSAPTGAGKTAIAEYVIRDSLSKNEGAIYTAPIKALSNQKFRDFQNKYANKIGILTGDVSINADAPILIMTTEIFRSKLLDEPASLNKYSWVIFDEIHYIDDFQRGTVWEESIIFLPRHMRILALSATIPNLDELASWIKSIHTSDLKIVKEDERPVPLHFFFQCQGKIIDNIHELKNIGYSRNLFYEYKGRLIPKNVPKPNRLNALIEHIRNSNNLPCIYFSFGRRRCEMLAEELYSYDFLEEGERSRIIDLYKTLCKKFDLASERTANILKPFIQRGIAYHHAGMLPCLKEVIERLFTSRLLKVIFTTETFALGINMPARAVVFDELRKFYGSFYRNLKTRDFYQMAGRAGRRGMDKEGFVYSRINPHKIEFNELQRIIYGKPEKVLSQFNSSYATILHLYNQLNERLYDIYPSSFHYYQAGPVRKKEGLELLRSKVALLKDMGYIRKNMLTEKGKFASQLYGYELPLTEFYEEGLLDKISEVELAILSCALVFEPRKGEHLIRPLKKFTWLKETTQKITNRIRKYEMSFGIRPYSKEFHFHLAQTLELWIMKHSFDKIREHSEVDEGEIVRYFRMSIQILRELLSIPDISAAIQGKITNAISKINRDIIDAEKELRTE